MIEKSHAQNRIGSGKSRDSEDVSGSLGWYIALTQIFTHLDPNIGRLQVNVLVVEHQDSWSRTKKKVVVFPVRNNVALKRSIVGIDVHSVKRT